jgi:hypothetical protein
LLARETAKMETRYDKLCVEMLETQARMANYANKLSNMGIDSETLDVFGKGLVDHFN